MKADDLRKIFLEFFKARGHTIIPSASLVPEGDPTLLFNVAGMVQFKQFYASKGPIPFTRAASVQKCLRATDLEEVGRTIKHHTFFEMLGNFSFGDYFKNEAIEWAWEFITEVVKLPKERLYVTVYHEDDESERIWAERIGVDRDRIYRLGKEDNFWGPAGLTGACGPCSEIHFDLGRDVGCGREDCSPACDCDRFVEVWNLVFPQFYQDESGNLSPLERKGVDTGMGLECLAMVCQGVSSTYDTDLLKPICDFVRDEASLDSQEDRTTVAVRVIADHSRALCFAIAEGVLPSNEGRGYVVRRILRRAVLRGLDLGIEEPFLYRVVGKVIDVMGKAYPEIKAGAEKVALIVKSDEERFQRTLSRGMAIFRQMLDEAAARESKMLSGQDVFKLYDTYGFPLEITQELARSHGIEVDVEGFEKAMDDQRERARQRSRIGKEAETSEDMTSVPENFVGYDRLEVPTVIVRIKRDGKEVEEASEGQEVAIELERTPFYPEGGGQVSDRGVIVGTASACTVSHVRWIGGTVIEHHVRVDS
ncbi:MAG TPA: alanine--tRNA ligase, partial [Firmicutes bacterium]|nr:alanine--tRNA ligase [Bacillota bacterium]